MHRISEKQTRKEMIDPALERAGWNLRRMSYNPLMHHRRSIRLKGYDYTQPGVYFVTLVAWQRTCLFGTIQKGDMSLDPYAPIITACWQRLPTFFTIYLDEWVIMPNHFHGIIVIESSSRGEASAKVFQVMNKAHLADSSTQRPLGTESGSLGAIIQNFKSISTRQFNQARHTSGVPIWQRNYYEHIIRNKAEWERIRQYIQTNPLRWDQDTEYVP